jgi:MoxR-like ATPase
MGLADVTTADQLKQVIELLERIRAEVERVLVGQRSVVDRLLLGLITGGHVLLEGVPGLGKTLAVRSLAQAVGGTFRRIQFTPDLLPADILGTQIFNPRAGEFSVRLGPIFANLVLADEINRAAPKVQSALLEAMQEKQVTIGENTYPLPELFLVMATQNPIEQEGTYPLPEAELDRFMFKVLVSYPSLEQEREILQRMGRTSRTFDVRAVTSPQEVLRARSAVDKVYLDERIEHYILTIVQATRNPAAFGLSLRHLIRYGASPRATIYLCLAAKAHALLERRDYVVPHDVKQVAPDVLRHRVLLTYEAEAEEKTPDDLIGTILSHLPVP